MFGMGGMGMGMDMGMGMGMDMGMNMGMDAGLMMGMEMGAMGMGMGMGGMGMGGMGRNEEIIVNNGNGTTIIEERGGMFGPREQIIMTNGMGRGMGGVTVMDNYGMYGGREQIIINNNGYNNYGYGGYGTNNVIVCPPNCQKQCCRPVVVNPPVVYTTVQPTHHHHHHHNKKVQVIQVTKQPQIVKGTPIVQTVKVDVNPYAQNNNYNQQKYHQHQQQQNQTVMLISHPLLQLKYGKWEGPREYAINKVKFDRFALTFITKLKCRTNLEPQSNLLQNGQIIMKVVIGENQQVYFAAKSPLIRDYFYNIILIRMRWNPPNFVKFQGQIQGKIMKKSQFFGNWELRHVRITTTEGLKSYKNPSEKHTLHIQSVRQLWTRFQIIQGTFLGIKVKHGHKKLQFGIPLNLCGPWVQAFYSLLEDYQ